MYARQGAPILEEKGTARFIHSTIQEYFVARALFDELRAIG